MTWLQRGPMWVASVALVVIALILAVGATGGGPPASASQVIVSGNQPAGINVNGEGKVSVVPDIALVTLSVEARAAGIEAARDQAAKAMEAVIKSLTGNGVDTKDIQTQSLQINPEWRNRVSGEPPQIVGYIVTNQVSVKIRQLTKATTTVDGVIGAGGNAIRMQSIRFAVDDPAAQAALNRARDAAVTDARAKANQLAKLAGVNVGRPIHLSDYTAGFPLAYAEKTAVVRSGAAAADMMTQTPIEPGQTEIRVTVQATYSIE